MELIDAYYIFKITWDVEYCMYRLTVPEANRSDHLIADFLKNEFVESYNDIQPCPLYGQKDYSIEYKTPDKSLALLRFHTWWEADKDFGIMESSIITDDCLLFKTDHNGLFEVYVFKNLKCKEDGLYAMLINGDLNGDLNSMLANCPF